MSIPGIDFSVGRPSVANMRTAGFKFVVRYIGSTDHTKMRHEKFITPSELKTYVDAGIKVCLVFETGGQRVDGGRNAGLADAKVVKSELAWLGLPADQPVYYAVDYDATVGPVIKAYFAAVNEIRGIKTTGVYGGYKVVKALAEAKLVTWLWQTYAWSYNTTLKKTVWYPGNHLEQYSNNVSFHGVSVDYDRAQKAIYGQHPADPATPDVEGDMLPGGVSIGPGEQCALGWAEGSYGTFGAWADTTFGDSGVVPSGQMKIRLAFLRTDGTFQIEHETIGRAKATGKMPVMKVKITDPAKTIGVSITREDANTKPFAIWATK